MIIAFITLTGFACVIFYPIPMIQSSPSLRSSLDSSMILSLVFSLLLRISPTIVGLILFQYEHKLTRDGQLIYGTITHFRSYTDSEGDLMVDAHYQFVTPRGSTFQNEERRVRNDLAGQPLPSVGTPVAIWYADDKTYRIL